MDTRSVHLPMLWSDFNWPQDAAGKPRNSAGASPRRTAAPTTATPTTAVRAYDGRHVTCAPIVDGTLMPRATLPSRRRGGVRPLRSPLMKNAAAFSRTRPPAWETGDRSGQSFSRPSRPEFRWSPV